MAWSLDPSVDPATISVGTANLGAAASTFQVHGLSTPEIIIDPGSFAGITESVAGEKATEDSETSPYDYLREVVFHEVVHYHRYKREPNFLETNEINWKGEIVGSKAALAEVEAYGAVLANKDQLRLNRSRRQTNMWLLKDAWSKLSENQKKKGIEFVPPELRDWIK